MEIHGCDISAAMVELAREKVGARCSWTSPTCASCRSSAQFDLVWALDDAINYLLSVEELERRSRGCAATLAPAGC